MASLDDLTLQLGAPMPGSTTPADASIDALKANAVAALAPQMPQQPQGVPQATQAGMFDDLIPKPASASAGSGMFDDLVPSFGSDQYINALATKHGVDPSFVRGLVNSQTSTEAVKGAPLVGGLVDKAGAWAAAAAHGLTGAGAAGDTMSDRAAKNLALNQDIAADFEREHPNLTTASNVIGGALALAPLGSTAIGARLLGMTGGSLPVRALTSAASGGAINAADAAIRGDDVSRGAAVGAGMGFAGPIAGRAIGGIVEGLRGAVSPSVAIPSADAIGNAADQGYKAVRSLGVTFKPAAISSLAANTEQSLLADGLRPVLAPKTFGVLAELQNPPSGATANFSDVAALRRVLGKVAGSPDATESMAATRMIDHLDNFLNAPPPGAVLSGNAKVASQLYRQANANYSALKTSDALQGKVDAADLQAASANSGANFENALRQRLRGVLNSPAQRRGFSPDEIVAMQSIVRGTAPANVLRAVGNLLSGGGGLGAMVTGGGAMMAGAGPAGFAVPAAGYVVKKIGNAMAANRAQQLDQLIRSRAPASQSAVAARAAADVARRGRLMLTESAGNVLSRATAPSFGSLAPAYPGAQ